MKYFIVADVHGFFTELQTALTDAGFDSDNSEHIFVSLGDLLDRGPMPLECLKFVNNLSNKILIRGNHEDLIEDAIIRQEFLYHDWSNGTTQTGLDLANIDNANDCTNAVIFDRLRHHDEYNKYIQATVDYYDDGKNIFVHGWIPCDKDDPNIFHAKNQHYIFNNDWKNGDWRTASWINGMDAWNQGVKIANKTIYCGHWHTSWGHSKIHKLGAEFPNLRSTNPEHRDAHFEPFIDNGIVALDACTAFSHKVNCFVVRK